jgi:diguanylate cyclase (GGDEF)-like protein
MTSGKRSSVLVVDDEPYILTTLAALLENEFDVSLANSADEAQEVFRTKAVDVILSDQKMPRKSGVELLEWVRAHHPKTIRLLMTGFAELEDAVEAINRGKVYRYLFKPWRSGELLQVLRDACRSHQLEKENQLLLEELHQLNQALEKRVLERTQSLEQANREMQQKNFMLEKLALTDPLTGLPNRRAIDRLAESEIRRRGRYPSALALGFVDADNFKEINRRYLLPGGDQVLIDLARALNTSMRTVDTVGRVGGEEFMVVAPETTFEGALVLGERIRSSVEKHPFSYNDEPIRVTVSAGFAVVNAGTAVEFGEIKHLSAMALGEAKAGGKNRAVILRFPSS